MSCKLESLAYVKKNMSPRRVGVNAPDGSTTYIKAR